MSRISPLSNKSFKRIAIIGAGNAGCITALIVYKAFRANRINCEIVIYHDLKRYPIELVGQGTVLGPPEIINSVLGIDWYNNTIDATFKTGILYEGWGKKKDKFFHPLSFGSMGIHFIPDKLTKAILEFKDFTIIEKNINEPEKEIDADLIFDCRGNYKRNKNEYEQLISPINTVLLSHKKEKEENLIYTKTIATPNGWTFIIPNKDSTSYGYLYNNKITSEKDATSDFIKRFDIEKVENKLIFDNYIAKNIFKNERTILQGNRYCFLEPLEANSLDIALNICSEGLKVLFKDQTKTEMETKMRKRIKEVETFLLWHYQFGSKYDTKFWEYAKSLPFNPDYEFKRIIKKRILNADYGQWQGYSFRNWIENVAIP